MLEFESNGPQVRPWIRFWARSFDLYSWALLIAIVSAFAFPAVLEIRDAILGLLIAFTYMFVEPLLLSTWGTTPGKALLRIRLRKADGRKPGYGAALERSFYVWTRGIGLGVPLIGLITQLLAYNRLKDKGVTSWDQACDFRVAHQVVGAPRAAIAVAIFLALGALIAYGETQ